MEIKKISIAQFNARSRSKGVTTFKPEFVTECSNAILENKGSCITICELENAMDNYQGKCKAQPSKIVAVFFIQLLKKLSIQNSNRGKVSVNGNQVNLNLM